MRRSLLLLRLARENLNFVDLGSYWSKLSQLFFNAKPWHHRRPSVGQYKFCILAK